MAAVESVSNPSQTMTQSHDVVCDSLSATGRAVIAQDRLRESEGSEGSAQPSVSSAEFLATGRHLQVYTPRGFLTRTRIKALIDMPAEEVLTALCTPFNSNTRHVAGRCGSPLRCTAAFFSGSRSM